MKKKLFILFGLIFLLANVIFLLQTYKMQELVKSLPKAKILQKLKNRKVWITKDKSYVNSSYEYYQQMISYAYSNLNDYFDLVDPTTSQKLLEYEAKRFQIRNNEPGNLWREHSAVNFKMHFAINVEKIPDPNRDLLYNVNIRSKIIQTSTAIMDVSTSKAIGANLNDTIRKAVSDIVEEIKIRIVTIEHWQSEGSYLIKFVLFNKQGDRKKIRKVLPTLEEEKKLIFINGYYKEAGKNFYQEKIQWLDSHSSQTDIISYIKKQCEKLGIPAISEYANNEEIIFQPPGSNWDGAPDLKLTTLQKKILAPSSFDTYLEINNSLSVKEGDLLKLPFQLAKGAPKNWYFSAIYFSTSEDIYQLFPNKRKTIKLLKPEKKYIFPDRERQRKNWGVAWKFHLPYARNEDTDQLLFLVTSKPIDLLMKNIAKSKKDTIVLNWEDMDILRQQISNQSYMHKVIDVKISKKK